MNNSTDPKVAQRNKKKVCCKYHYKKHKQQKRANCKKEDNLFKKRFQRKNHTEMTPQMVYDVPTNFYGIDNHSDILYHSHITSVTYPGQAQKSSCKKKRNAGKNKCLFVSLHSDDGPPVVVKNIKKKKSNALLNECVYEIYHDDVRPLIVIDDDSDAGGNDGDNADEPGSKYENNNPMEKILQLHTASGVDVAFDVRPRTSASTTTGAPTAGESTPAGFNNNNNNNQASPSVAPTTMTSSPTASGTASPAVAPTMANPHSAIPLPGPTPFASASQNVWGGMSRENSPPNEARRNSTDGWTLLNRESPTRGEAMAVDVEEVLGARPKTVYPQLPKETPAAASTLPSAPVNPQNQKIQEAIEKIRSMGFNFDPILVKDLLQNQNCDIVTVLEMLLGNTEKK